MPCRPPYYYRLLATGAPLDEASARRAADAAFTAARAGAYKRAPTPARCRGGPH